MSESNEVIVVDEVSSLPPRTRRQWAEELGVEEGGMMPDRLPYLEEHGDDPAPLMR